MSELESDGDGDFRSESKYKQFSAAVERALKSFEVSTEWPDLISSLARLNKVLLAYKQYPVVPYQLTVCKRLSQCLHPNLPGGVHLKVLDVYRAIFTRLGTDGLAHNLLVYSSGLFPLMSYASMSVRPSLLDVYEKHYLPLGADLNPSLHGFALGLLPGLEDESEHTERITHLLDAVATATDRSMFFSALWSCVLYSSDVRLQAVGYILSKLNRRVTAEDQMDCLGGNLPLVVSAACAALLDGNVLVARTTLDIVSTLFPLHQPFLLPSDSTLLLAAALQTLLRRDLSLSRRLSAWVLGSQVESSQMTGTHLSAKPSSQPPTQEVMSSVPATPTDDLTSDYFQRFARTHLLSALREIIAQSLLAVRQSSKTDSILPYRLLRALLDKPEIGDRIATDILLDVVVCLKTKLMPWGLVWGAG